MGMSYEDKMRFLANVRPEKKDELLMKLAKGEIIDITKDEDLFFQINVDRMPIEQLMNRQCYVDDAEDLAKVKRHLHDPRYGKMKGGSLKRWICDIPTKLWFTHPWFSPTLPKAERDANIRKFANLFPKFRIGSKEI